LKKKQGAAERRGGEVLGAGEVVENCLARERFEREGEAGGAINSHLTEHGLRDTRGGGGGKVKGRFSLLRLTRRRVSDRDVKGQERKPGRREPTCG